MFSLTYEQILVVCVLSVWFLFPLGILVSFIKQSNEAHTPKIKYQPIANDIAHSKAYAPDVEDDDDDEDLDITPVPPYQIPKSDTNSNNYHPRV